MLDLLKDRRAIALLLAASLTILSNTLISPALPGIEAHFAGQPNAGLWTRLLITAPSLTVAICAPFAGMLADRFGRRRQLLFGVILFAISGSAGMWLPTLHLILASRFILGLAVALIMTAQTALIGDYFSGSARGRFMGLQLAGTNFGGLLFVLISGALAGLSPFAPFAIYAIALLYLPFLWIAVKEPSRETPASDPSQANGAGQKGWQGIVAVVLAFAMISMICFYILPTQAPYYLADLGVTDPSMTALLLALVTLAGGAASLTFAKINERLGRAKTSALGFGLFSVGFMMLANAGGLTPIFAGAVVTGLAIGYLMPLYLSIALEVAPLRKTGLVAGSVTTSIFLGQFLSPIVTQSLIGATGFATTFLVMAGILMAIAIASPAALRQKPTGVL